MRGRMVKWPKIILQQCGCVVNISQDFLINQPIVFVRWVGIRHGVDTEKWFLVGRESEWPISIPGGAEVIGGRTARECKSLRGRIGGTPGTAFPTGKDGRNAGDGVPYGEGWAERRGRRSLR